MKLSEIVDDALKRLEELYEECQECKSSSVDKVLSELELLHSLSGIASVSACTACVLAGVLEEHVEIPRVELETVYGPTTIYVADECLSLIHI
mgnify:CR=1 FL=1